jgi:hypothetical protein
VLVDWAILFYFLFFWRFAFYLTVGTNAAGYYYVGVPLAGWKGSFCLRLVLLRETVPAQGVPVAPWFETYK